MEETMKFGNFGGIKIMKAMEP